MIASGTEQGSAMAAVTVRNLPDEVYQALKIRAAGNNRSTEAVKRTILEATVRPERPEKLGTILQRIGQGFSITHADIEAIEQARATRQVEPFKFD